MISIELKNGQSGYDAVGECIRRFWKHNTTDTVIVSIGTSYMSLTFPVESTRRGRRYAFR